MAIWQENVVVLPSTALEVKERLDLENEDVYLELWKERKMKADCLIEQIDAFISRADWVNSEKWIYWKGDTNNREDDDISLVFDKETNVISEFSFRFDTRARTTKFLESMIGICEQNNLVFQVSNREIIEPKIDAFSKVVADSDFKKFLKDPVKFVEELKEKPWNSHLRADDEDEKQRILENNLGIKKEKLSLWDRLKTMMK